ncbi:lactose-binding lectin l-2-like [Hemibagrus wyckioides]|uniref:lactose-binding lectin l-2-like n=1 Tax=Hemibagrus wyckioides TaxID=337641 RepID=UPI00266C24E0|nr:lactose-binding lectin l-2-like [Hemibagrus wyckioides]
MARQTEVVLLLIVTIAATAFADVEKPLSVDYFDQLVKVMPLLFSSFQNHCLKFGSNMMSVHNNNEYQLAKSLIRAYDPKDPPTWLGLSNCQKRHNWFWSDGTKVTFTKWNPTEPNFRNNECCVHMNWGGQKDWNDIPCEETYPFVCAKKIN